MSYGPQTPVAELIHAEKYRGPGESFEEAMNRIAAALCDNGSYRPTREILLQQRFLPAGRIQTAIGSTRVTTPYNCYVSGTIEDSLSDGEGSIVKRLAQAARTMQLGGGIGYNFGTLRPRGADIRKLQSRSTGAVSWIEPFNALGLCISSAGHRRGAQMGVLPIWHPDVEEFIRAKQNQDKLTGFNISLAVTDEFMHAVEEDAGYDLRWNGTVYRTIRARDLFEMVMRSTWDWAEPGVLFIDRINAANNLWYCEHIAATNPCGEQPLPPFGACLLGSFNLPKYVKDAGKDWAFDLDEFMADIPLVVAMMDRVIDVAVYPLYEQEKEAKAKRRMGLGVTGLANAGEALGYRYGTAPFLAWTAEIMRVLRDETYRASARLAESRGVFPLYDEDQYLAGEFTRTLPEDVRELIRAYGIRNSHLTSIAPTGTISLTADNVSSGIEPVYQVRVQRTVNTLDGPQEFELEDFGARIFGTEPRTAGEVSAREHVDVLAAVTPFVDSAVSKTCNVPPDMPWADFKELYMDAWRRGCKGCTTFNHGGKRFGILRASAQEAAACKIDPMTGKGTCE